MNVYFFLWNPKIDPQSFVNYDEVQRKARIGQPYEADWICPSTQPRYGDVAIMQRTGNHHNGVFAKGIVTCTPYVDKRGVRRVGLKLDSFLPLGQEISREEITSEANYRKKWVPMSSGNIVAEPLVQAIQSLWKERNRLDLPSPKQKLAQESLFEGTTTQVLVTAIERNAKARKLCLSHYGLDCWICGFNFKAVYGDVGRGLIHIHHLKPLSQNRQKHEVDPVKDLRPVCPNCHAVIHSKEPPYTVNQMKKILRNH